MTIATAPELDAAWSPELIIYISLDAGEDIAESHALEGTRHVHAQMFSDPIAFQLHVPAKNQPKVFDSDTIPSEDYFVLWDGGNLLVGWEQPAGGHVGSSGGHIVEEVVEQAVERAGVDLMVQACNPDCACVFLHTAIHAVVQPELATDWYISRSGDDSQLMEAVISDVDDSLVDVCLMPPRSVAAPQRRSRPVPSRRDRISAHRKHPRRTSPGRSRRLPETDTSDHADRAVPQSCHSRPRMTAAISPSAAIPIQPRTSRFPGKSGKAHSPGAASNPGSDTPLQNPPGAVGGFVVVGWVRHSGGGVTRSTPGSSAVRRSA